MDALADALRDGFSAHVDDVEVRRLGPSHFHVRFKVDGRGYGCAATAIGAGIFAPEDTAFIATTWAHDPLSAFGRRMDWRIIDGYDHDHNPAGAVRSGLPSELAASARQSASNYAEARWPSQETERYAFR